MKDEFNRIWKEAVIVVTAPDQPEGTAWNHKKLSITIRQSEIRIREFRTRSSCTNHSAVASGCRCVHVAYITSLSSSEIRCKDQEQITVGTLTQNLLAFSGVDNALKHTVRANVQNTFVACCFGLNSVLLTEGSILRGTRVTSLESVGAHRLSSTRRPPPPPPTVTGPDCPPLDYCLSI